jgi:carbamoyl-phosphate synthase large subunit
VNVLLASSGRRVELLRILQHDLEELGGGVVVAADASQDAPTMHLAELAVQLPRLGENGFPDALIQALDKYGIGLVIPTIDTELPVLCSLRDEIAAAGARLLLSGPRTIEVAGDKIMTAEFLDLHGIPGPVHWTSTSALELAQGLPYPVIVKPRGGSASVGVRVVTDPVALHSLLGPDAIVQEIATGDEFTVDVWIDAEGSVRSSVARRRISVRGGEVDRSVTERNEGVLRIAETVARCLPDAFGPLNIQVFADGDVLKVIEINARYGGGFPLSWRSGARTTRWALQFGLGAEPRPQELPWREGVRMLRFDESVFIDAP